MKYIVTLVLIMLFFSIPILSQEKNYVPSPYESLINKLNDFNHLNKGDLNNFNEEELFNSNSGDNKLLQKLKKFDNKFNSSDDINTRITSSETLLGEGFLQVENITQSWDGTAWVNEQKGSNIYDARNNRVQSTYQTWTSGAWENNYRYLYVFDANNNQIEYTYQNWSGTAWVDVSKYLFTYDANNNLTVQLNQTWSGTAWTNSSRYLYTYNANNKVTLRRYQNWNGTAWVDNSRSTYTYDANNNQIEQIYESWSGMLWVFQYKYISTYDVNNNLTQQIFQNWSGTAWVNSSKYNITYNATEDPIEYIFQIWDVSVWKNDFKYTFTYNANNDPIELLFQNWTVSSVWENSSKNILTYDSNNNNTEQLSQTWNGTTWVNNWKYLYTWAPETSIEVTSPNGGENWPVGTVRNITWTSSNVSNVRLQYSTNNGTDWLNINNVSASAGSYAWTTPNTTSTNCLVLISDVSNALLFDESDTIFTISPAVTPTITVSAPNGGENWEVGSAHSITWTSNNVTNVKIDYTTNNGTNWLNIVSSTPSNGTFSWTIPNAPSTNCKVQISDVTNAQINDQSNNVFTISVPVTPVISVSSPNGGENWVVGSVHNINWISSNVANVRIDYTTTGTDLINIITSTPAAAQSYSWTVPNTASTNCKVIISDVANLLTNDVSNNVFTISVNTYPSTITLSTTYSFGDPAITSSYQIIGLPGANNLLMTNIITGTPGATGDWRAFWDNGAANNYMIEFDGTSTFNFTPGKAFWIVSKNQINVNRPNVNTVTLATDNSYSIPLHSGWNLISNPFDKSISWSSINIENGGNLQPIHFFQTGSYTMPTSFEPYKGYYFNNPTTGALTSLKLPYSSPNPLPKQNSVSLTELEIMLNADGVQKAFISVGVSENAKTGVDWLDIFSPPSQFCDVNISLRNNELETKYKYLQTDYRPEIGEGQEFDFVIKNISDQTLDMVISGLDNFMDYEIFLLDKKLSKLYNLKKLNSFEVKSITIEKEYSLLIGTEEFILQKKSDIMPTEFSLFQNYPNPFNPATRIMFSLPQQSNVSLKIYNILGELATELINNQSYDAGYHEVTFDGSQFASGTYLYRLQTSSAGKEPFVEIKKMILIK